MISLDTNIHNGKQNKNANIQNKNSEIFKDDTMCPGALPRLYLKYVASSLEADKETGRLTSKQIDDIKQRCEGLSNPNNTSKYGDIKSFPTSKIRYYLEKYHNKNNFRIKFNNAKGSNLESLEKLFLCAKKFVDDFFEDMQSSYSKNKENYLNLQTQIRNMYNIKDISQKLSKDSFLRALEIELTARIMTLIENDKEHDISVITALTHMTQKSKMKKFFLNLLKADFDDLSLYASSKYRGNLSSMYGQSCKIPNVQKFNELVKEFIEDKNINIEDTDNLLSSISGMFNQKGVPTEKEFEAIKGIISDCKDIDNENYLDIFSSFTSMLNGKGSNDLDVAKSFLDEFIKFANKHNIKDSKQKFDLFSSITGMFNGKGVPTEDEFKAIRGIIEDCKNIDNEKYLDIFSSFTSMLNGKGSNDLDVAKSFLDEFIKFANKHNIKDSKQKFDLFSSITGMFNGKGVPTEDEFKAIRGIIEDCKNIDNENYLDIFSSFTSMLCGEGANDLSTAMNFYIDFTTFSKDELEISNMESYMEQVTTLFKSISSMFSTKGVPTQDEFETFKKIILACKKKDSKHFVRFFKNISNKYPRKKIPQYKNIDDFINKQYNDFVKQFKKYEN